ncbi:zinc-dependent alcohol dehydrogenase [Natrialbaceae archaeon A-chndr2]
MKAVVQTGPSSLRVDTLERPQIDADQVLIRVGSTGVCGSDVHAYLYEGGYEWVELPRIMGHEYAGEIVETGSAVTDFAAGDRVVENPTLTCGTCFQCLNEQSNVCQNFSVKGMHRDGSYAEYTVANPDKLHTIPESVPMEHAAITEPLSVAARAVLSRSTVTPGDTVLVEGPGPIGALVAAIADSIGGRVLVSGLSQDEQYRLPLLEDLGIETAVSGETLDSKTQEITDGIGFDVVFDTTGHHSGVELAVEIVRKGGQIVVVGLPGSASEIPMSTIVRGEVDIKTSYGSKWANFEQALSLMSENTIRPDGIIDDRYSLSDPAAAFTAFLDSKTCKPVFTFDE